MLHSSTGGKTEFFAKHETLVLAQPRTDKHILEHNLIKEDKESIGYS